MAPTKFHIYVDQSVRQVNNQVQLPPPQQQSGLPPQHQQQPVAPSQPQPQPQPQRFRPEVLAPGSRFYFDERKLYPVSGGEYCFEELNLICWQRLRKQRADREQFEEIMRENEELKQQIEALNYQLMMKQQQQQQMQQNHYNQQQQHYPPGRPSIVPMSLQPTNQGEYVEDVENVEKPMYGAVDEATTGIQDCWSNTVVHDVSKLTLPIDQSQYIRENVPTSTPTSKRPGPGRRWSRPSMGGSPTLKLSPINETSRDCNSKSSSSSSALSATPGTVKKVVPQEEEVIERPVRQLDPNDPTTYQRLLKAPDYLDRRAGYYKLNRSVPKIRQGACFQAGGDNYLVDKELSAEAKMFTAQLLSDDSNDSSADIQIKTVCFRLDQPANEWLFYICNELHRRLVKQKTKPDIELSVMNANPSIMYSDASILVDEYFRFVTLQDFFDACTELKKPFPKSVAAYITLELIQLIRQMHICDINHLNIIPSNILIICCPTRDDIANVEERTSIVKLIGFDRAIDTRLLPANFKFEGRLADLVTCEMLDSKPWSYEVDWFGALSCIYNMLFLEDMIVEKNQERWTVDKQFKGLPTNVWNSMFDELLNIESAASATSAVDKAIDELNSWVKANISFVLKEAACLDSDLEKFLVSKKANK